MHHMAGPFGTVLTDQPVLQEQLSVDELHVGDGLDAWLPQGGCSSVIAGHLEVVIKLVSSAAPPQGSHALPCGANNNTPSS